MTFWNIILIGMPGSGKSTVGALLARETGKAFVDTDRLIELQTGRTLQAIVDQNGYLDLRRVEERVILDLDCRNMVIATGGSAVYSRAAMDHLRADGVVILLKVGLDALKKRVQDYDRRGLAKRPEQSLDDLFAERSALYNAYADIMIDCDGLAETAVCTRILDALRSRRDPI